ncbi:MAG TPA: patatin-like phospholipase family protein [Firmicutes bacterium]|nr:patatin-like phospholipase family protein [Bacillota bacterium]
MAAKVGLALSGGAVRGLAHIGVLEVLEQAGLVPWCVAGTSVGSVIGALFCGGMEPHEMIELARHASWPKITRPVIPREGFMDTSRLESFLRHIAGDLQFEDLRFKLGVVVTDLLKGTRVLVTSGDVWSAVAASCAIPGVFTPVKDRGTILVDGGVVENIPVRAAVQMGADSVIVSDVTRIAQRSHPANLLQVILQSLDIMQRQQAERAIAMADLVIQPDMTDLSMWDFSKADELYERGKAAARSALKNAARIGLLPNE